MEIYGFIDGVKKSLTQLAAESGVSYDTLLARYKAGVPFGELADIVEKSGGVSDEELAKLRSEIERFRPNLLDNSDFSNPVNQRGETVYTTTAIAFAIDRWQHMRGTLTCNAGFINWKSSSDAAYKRLIQKLGVKFTAGKTYTLAMLAKVNTVSGTVNFRLGNDTAPVSGATKQIRNTTAGFEWFVMSHTVAEDIAIPSFDILVTNTASDYLDIDIKAAAIYEGEYTVDTLPVYQPKGYATELAECQRYFQRFENSHESSNFVLAIGQATISTRAFFAIYLPVPMRIYPTITVSGASSIILSNDGQQTVFTATSVNSAGGLGPNGQDFSQRSFSVVTSGLTAKQVYMAYVKSGGYVDLSAEI